jgi:hypothetical protein
LKNQEKKTLGAPNFDAKIWSTERLFSFGHPKFTAKRKKFSTLQTSALKFVVLRASCFQWSKARPRAWEGQKQFALEFLLSMLKSLAMNLGGPKA